MAERPFLNSQLLSTLKLLLTVIIYLLQLLHALSLSKLKSSGRAVPAATAPLQSLQLDHDDADVVLASAGHGQLRQQCRGVCGGPPSDAIGELGGRPAAEAVPGDLARHLVGHHVPQPVAGQDEELVLLRAVHHSHLRLGAHVRLQVVVT